MGWIVESAAVRVTVTKGGRTNHHQAKNEFKPE